jgi:gliding motility-associated-like protein
MSDSGSNFNVIVSGLCNTNDTSINVSLKVNPIPIAIASSNSPVCKDSSIYLSSNLVSGSTYSWTGPNFYVSSIPSPTIVSASTLNAGIYSLIITANNCNSLPADINLLINDCPKLDFFIPDAFSPNGDGINDVFFIRGLNLYSKSSIEIYNRWGEKIYSANPYLNNWNGACSSGLRIGSSVLPVGTYFYLLNLGDNSPIIKGSIYLNN